jgi:hypothetical protein
MDEIKSYKSDAAEGERRRQHTHVLPVQVFFLLCQYERLDKTVWHVLAHILRAFIPAIMAP